MRQIFLILLLAPGLLHALFSGTDVTSINDANFMVRVLTIDEEKNVENYKCSGVIVDARAIITTAQCVAPKGKKVKSSEIKLEVGLIDSSKTPLGTPKVKEIVIPPGYTGGKEDNIAVLALGADVSGGAKINTIATDGWFKNTFENEPTKKVTVYGWGGTAADEKESATLQQIEYILSDQDECKEYWNTRGMNVGDKMFCAGGPDVDEHAWTGDEGGPVFYNNGQDNVLVGIVSWGKELSPRLYDVMTDVEEYKDLIDKAVAAADEKQWVELEGGLNHGLVLLHSPIADGPHTICTNGIADNEIKSICESLGFTDGKIQGSRNYATNRPKKGYEAMREIGATVSCAASTLFKDCTVTEYPTSGTHFTPCFDGQQLAVKCYDKEWDFHFEDIEVKLGKDGKSGRVMCRLTANLFGDPVDVKSEIIGQLVNIQDSGNPVVVEKEMKWRSKDNIFLDRYKNTDHNCFACLATVRGSTVFQEYVIEEDSGCKMLKKTAQEKLDNWLSSYDPEDKNNQGS